ncbi:hypothetical protein B9Z55_012511 [Caenorhabditis nigoni]|nr:hypothetical protein B9Z55_012511 [Caenorhabditis nigoni]
MYRKILREEKVLTFGNWDCSTSHKHFDELLWQSFFLKIRILHKTRAILCPGTVHFKTTEVLRRRREDYRESTDTDSDTEEPDTWYNEHEENLNVDYPIGQLEAVFEKCYRDEFLRRNNKAVDNEKLIKEAGIMERYVTYAVIADACQRLPTLADACRRLPTLADACRRLPTLADACRCSPVLADAR